MAEMGSYCKAYLAESFAQFDGWKPNLGNLRPESDDDGEDAPPRTELRDDDVLYLQESYVVTDGIYLDENVVFDDVTDEWKTFCTETLKFEIPAYEPIEIPRGDEATSEEATS